LPEKAIEDIPVLKRQGGIYTLCYRIAANKKMVDELNAIRLITQGDSDALRFLYVRYSTGVLALLCRMLGSSAEAEEQLQEVFLVLWREAARFDPERGSLRAWLYTMARRRALDLIRARQSRPQPGPEEDVSQSPTRSNEKTEETPERNASANQRAIAVSEAIAQLPPKQREVLDLAYFQGLSQYEIAAKLNVPIGTIKSRVRDAMIRLRQPLEEHQE
jgi:RNA polymerase sigma-70 factor (ECF subfamily)